METEGDALRPQYLGILRSDEFQFKVGDVPYLGQVWSPVVGYVKFGDWGNVKRT